MSDRERTATVASRTYEVWIGGAIALVGKPPVTATEQEVREALRVAYRAGVEDADAGRRR